MKPADIALLRVPGRPAIGGDGSIVAAVQSPDLEADLYRSTLLRWAPESAGASTEFTVGPRDTEPVISPDGRSVVFLRAPESGPAQLHLMPLHGGEPRKLTDHILGAGSVIFAADGQRIAYCAPVPDAGRYGTDKAVKPEAEPPRLITRMSYRSDGEGFVIDKPRQLFVLDIGSGRDVAEPVQVTDEPFGVADPAFTADGRLVYVRSTGADELTHEIALTTVPDGPLAPTELAGRRVVRLVSTRGSASLLTVAGNEIYYVGVDFTGVDAAGRNAGLWAASMVDGASPRRLTDAESVDVDRGAGRPLVMNGAVTGGDRVLVGVLDRGATTLVTVPTDADSWKLHVLPVLIGATPAGPRVVRSFTTRQRSVAAVVASDDSAGEVVVVDIADDGSGTNERQLSDCGRLLAATGLRPAVELTANAPDGYPVHGWLVSPPGDGPHPVLLVVHGGPHAAYTPTLFDEAQVYAGAGYAVVLGNPRGSAGYGQAHGRAVLGALGTVDVDDLLALLDAALARPDCDAARVGVMGGSYGGFITSWLCSQAPGRFAAAISERAVNAWDSFAGSSDIGYYFAQAYVGADRESQWRTSPLAYADQIDVPLLIIHSEHDWRCPLEQAQRLFVALKSRSAEVELLLFPAEGHELSRSGHPRHRLQRFNAILAWWDRYLPVTPAVPASVPSERN